MRPADKYRELVDRLYARTTAKKIEWEALDGNPFTRIGNSEIYLKESRDMNGEPSIEVVIQRPDGEVIEAFDDLALRDEAPKDYAKFPTYWVMMSNLREIAHRQAIGADDALDEILGQLGDDLP